jgi:hypothetical protein
MGIVLIALLPAAVRDGEHAGPLPVRILDPRFAPHLVSPSLPSPPEPDGVRLSFDMGTGQVWKGDSGPGGTIGISAQTVSVRFAGQWSLANFLSAGWEIPFLFHAKSFKRSQDPFNMDIEYGSAVLADADSPTGGISDACLSLSLHHVGIKDPLKLLRLSALLKVPSGGRKAYIGTGRAELGGFLDFSVETKFRIFLHGRIGVVYVGDPRGESGGKAEMGAAIPFRAGIEWRPTRGPGIHLQVEGSNNFHPETGHERLDAHPLQATLGVSYNPGPGTTLWLGFSEDLTRSAPDFAVSAGFATAFP